MFVEVHILTAKDRPMSHIASRSLEVMVYAEILRRYSDKVVKQFWLIAIFISSETLQRWMDTRNSQVLLVLWQT